MKKSNVVKLKHEYDQRCCPECYNETFILVLDKGKIMAVCKECKTGIRLI